MSLINYLRPLGHNLAKRGCEALFDSKIFQISRVSTLKYFEFQWCEALSEDFVLRRPLVEK